MASWPAIVSLGWWVHYYYNRLAGKQEAASLPKFVNFFFQQPFQVLLLPALLPAIEAEQGLCSGFTGHVVTVLD